MRYLYLALPLFGYLFVAVTFSNCSSKERNFDQELNVSMPDQKEKVGLKGDTIVIQKRIAIESELYSLQYKVERLQGMIYGESLSEPGGLWISLRSCQERISDPRIGGNGISDFHENWQNILDRGTEYKYSIDKNNGITGVSEEDLFSRIKRLKTTSDTLEQRYEQFRNQTELCEHKYRTALINHGLNPEHTKATGQWIEGPEGFKVWELVTPATYDPKNSLAENEVIELANSRMPFWPDFSNIPEALPP